MKKLAILFSVLFVFGILSASAQTSSGAEKQTTKTETVKSDDGAKVKGCCIKSTTSCKAGSMKCCMKSKGEKSSIESSNKEDAVIPERKVSGTLPDSK